MKKITKDTVRHIAYLSRLDFTEEEIEIYTQQLENILEYMDKLNKVDTTDVEPVSHIIFMLKDKINVNMEPHYREDVPEDSETQKEILSNAPEKVDKFFKVEKIIE